MALLGDLHRNLAFLFFKLRMTPTLSKYIFREHLKYFLLTLAALLPMLLMIHAMEKTRKLPHAISFSWLLTYLIYVLPHLIAEFMPLILLIATWLTWSMFQRNREIVAFLSLGVSIRQCSTVLILWSLGLSLCLGAFNVSLLPQWFHTARDIHGQHIEKKSKRIHIGADDVWFLEGPRTVWNIQMVEPDKQRMHGVRLFYFDDAFALTETLDAKILTRTVALTGILHHGTHRKFLSDGTIETKTFSQRILSPIPLDFTQLDIKADEMTLPQLAAHVRRLSAAGLKEHRYKTDLHARIALPFASFVMTLIAVLFAAQLSAHPRGRPSGIAVSVLYWLATTFFLSLGHAGKLPPWIAAWGPNILYAGGGMVAWGYIERRLL